MAKKLYEYSEEFGRMGDLSGIFVAEEADVARAMGETAYLGEVLGKHANITASISPDTIRELTDDADFVAKFVKFGCGSGTNPVADWLYQQKVD